MVKSCRFRSKPILDQGSCIGNGPQMIISNYFRSKSRIKDLESDWNIYHLLKWIKNSFLKNKDDSDKMEINEGRKNEGKKAEIT